jgi:hypothetical protein
MWYDCGLRRTVLLGVTLPACPDSIDIADSIHIANKKQLVIWLARWRWVINFSSAIRKALGKSTSKTTTEWCDYFLNEEQQEVHCRAHAMWYASQAERTELTNSFNGALEVVSGILGSTYLDITGETIDTPSGLVSGAYCNKKELGDHHLDNEAVWMLWVDGLRRKGVAIPYFRS